MKSSKHVVVFDGFETKIIPESEVNHNMSVLGVFSSSDQANDYLENQSECIINTIM